MADITNRDLSQPISQRFEDGTLITPANYAGRVLNLEATTESSLRTITGPAKFTSESGTDIIHGVFHTQIRGQDVLLRQNGAQLEIFRGSGKVWDVVNFPTGYTADAEFASDDRPATPTQWAAVPGGVIIIPRTGEPEHPLFFDGITLTQLGYARAPGRPRITGTAKNESLKALSAGYASMVGTVVDTGLIGDEYAVSRPRNMFEGVVQWGDDYGNLSPQSARGSFIVTADRWTLVTDMETGLFQVEWSQVAVGPPGTTSRICSRTKDLLRDGDPTVWEISPNLGTVSSAADTIQDNISETTVDNVPIGRLVLAATDVAPMPRATVCAVAMGSSWFNSPDGGLWWSLEGRYGTIGANNFMYPDTNGETITALYAYPGGLLAFTPTSTFKITRNDSGGGFRAVTLHRSLGTDAPSSVCTLSSGRVLFLSRSGFVGVDGDKVSREPGFLDKTLKRMNRARSMMAHAVIDPRRNTYMCWVPMGASKVPNLCFTNSGGAGWARRDDVQATASCVTQDHREYTIVGGTATAGIDSTRKGVFVLNRVGKHEGDTYHTAQLETSWLASAVDNRTSLLRVSLFMRETDGIASTPIMVEVMRDFRYEVLETHSVLPYATDDPANTWDATLLGGGELFSERRPYRAVIDVFVPSSDTFKLRLSYTGDMDYIGMTVQTTVHADGGGRHR